MKRFIFILTAVILTLSIIQPASLAVQDDDELGREFIPIFNHDNTIMTMFYDEIPNAFYRRELNLLTDKYTSRDSISVPILSEAGFHKNFTYFDLLSENRLPIDIPVNAYVIAYHYALTIGLENSFIAMSELARIPDAAVSNMYYDVLVRRLHNNTDDDIYQDILGRLSAEGFELVRPEVLRVEPGILLEEVHLAEINEEGKIGFYALFDPIEIGLLEESGPGVVAINIDREREDIYKIPVTYEHNMTKFTIAEAGTYVVVADGFLADPVNYNALLAGLDEYRTLVDIFNRKVDGLDPEDTPEPGSEPTHGPTHGENGDIKETPDDKSGSYIIWIVIPCAIAVIVAAIVYLQSRDFLSEKTKKFNERIKRIIKNISKK